MLKEEVDSCTMSAESLLLSRVIDMKEDHNAMNLDSINIFSQRGIVENDNGK